LAANKSQIKLNGYSYIFPGHRDIETSNVEAKAGQIEILKVNQFSFGQRDE